MSGHSKWSQIKHKKAASDAKKGQVYGKLARMITVAAREKGPDPNTNPALRVAIEKARTENMPSDNVERAIKRASGGEKDSLTEVMFEAYGPGGVAILITGITDNANRTSQEIKHILSEHGAKLAGPGSAKFLFGKTADSWQANSLIPVDENTKEQLTKLFEALDDHDDVQDIFSNAEL
ncbi:MAG: YebC/PmpR family DNA-binding transcriptional regulator [Patescibacteria group bacterium]